MDLAIFGAQSIALGAYEALKTLYPSKNIRCFLVSKMGMNRSVLGGLPVIEVDAFAAKLSAQEKDTVEVLIATPEDVQSEIEEILEHYGFPYYQKLDANRWSELMKLFHSKLGKFLPFTVLPTGYHKPFVRIYMAKSHKDRVLKNEFYIPDYMVPIHAGAENSGIQVAGLMDNCGDNISGKNGNYSELTVLYWMWKNKLFAGSTPDIENRQYYGLAQYRRILNFNKDDFLRLADNDVDVVLPYPMPYEPNIQAHHKRYLNEADWNALLRALRELQIDYADFFPKVLEQRYLYHYNVILAKKNVLRDYCAWLFPLLARVEELSSPKESERSDRYLGYMGESLETLYFMKNSKKLNIVHTECRLLV